MRANSSFRWRSRSASSCLALAAADCACANFLAHSAFATAIVARSSATFCTNAAADDPPWWAGDKAQDRQRGDALAAAAFTDDTQRLARRDLIRHAIDRTHDPGGGEEMRFQLLDFEQR